jgi:hypothetical protein
MNMNIFERAKSKVIFQRFTQTLYNQNKQEEGEGIPFPNSSSEIASVKGGSIDQNGK